MASGGVASKLSLVGGAPSRADPVVGTRVVAETVSPTSAASSPHVFEVGCAELHPVRCDVLLRGADLESLVSIAREHGAHAHGFTPVWYSSRALAAMAAIVSQRCGLNAP